MADCMAAEIWIGGTIAAAVVPKLCAAIADEGVSTEWSGGQFQPATAEELLAEVQPNGNEVPLLRLCDDEARWGELASLERFLEENRIAFTRFSDGKYEYDPVKVAYRPSTGRIELLTNSKQEAVVVVSELAPVEKELTRAAERAGEGTHGLAAAIRKAFGLLRDALPPSIPALEPFEIVDGPVSQPA